MTCSECTFRKFGVKLACALSISGRSLLKHVTMDPLLIRNRNQNHWPLTEAYLYCVPARAFLRVSTFECESISVCVSLHLFFGPLVMHICNRSHSKISTSFSHTYLYGSHICLLQHRLLLFFYLLLPRMQMVTSFLTVNWVTRWG